MEINYYDVPVGVIIKVSLKKYQREKGVQIN